MSMKDVVLAVAAMAAFLGAAVVMAAPIGAGMF
jgi:hypothetical protein